MKPVVLIPTLFIFVFMAINYQALFGLLGAQLEAWRLRENAAGRIVLHNPPDATDSFDNVLSDVWETQVINGSGMVHPGPEFSSGKFEVKDGSLFMYLRKDPDFENKPTSKRYNNVALIGFRGYSPAPDRDIVARALMQAGPGFFGTAGIVFEPVHTLQQDGSFRSNAPFNMFGASIIGPESEVYGHSGAVCSMALNWWPSASSLGDINIYEPHTYEIRLQWLSERSWLGIVSVDGTERCRMELPPFGPVELQIWSDGYWLSTSPWWKLHTPQLN
ncbi:MAG: hypothetical protein L0Z71_01450, partial [Anaerolineae bacterium]|nr:hypothetical protein [Anaerolineae bacterium]